MSNQGSSQGRYRFQLSFLHPRHWLVWVALLLFFIITLLPVSIIDWLGLRLGKIVASKNNKRFNIIKTNLALCFPDKSHAEIETMVVKNFQAQYRSLLHYYILWWRPGFVLRKKIHKTGFEQITHYQQQGKNIIILLVHTVGLDFAGVAISMDNKTTAPYKPVRNPVVDWLIANGRLRFGKPYGSKLFTREDGLRPLIRETRSGTILVYLADEDLGKKSSIFAPFYGVQKATIPLLGRLAKSCDAVVLPCVSCYDTGRRRYSIQLLPKIEGFPVGNDEQDSQKMNQAIEQAVERCPAQYLWALRYFKTRPEGEKSVYD